MSHVRRTLLLCLLLGVASNYAVGVAIYVVPAWIMRGLGSMPSIPYSFSSWMSSWLGPDRSTPGLPQSGEFLDVRMTAFLGRIEQSANYIGPIALPTTPTEMSEHRSTEYFSKRLQGPGEVYLLDSLRDVRLNNEEWLVSLGVTRVGWPCMSLTSTNIAKIGDAGVNLQYHGAIELPFRGYGNGRVMLPLLPLWPGFALNSLFWGGVWMLAMFGIPALIARRRVNAEHCAGCKYDLRGISTPQCPECGRAVLAAGGVNRADTRVALRPLPHPGQNE